MADREVVFTGKFIVSPDARKNFEELGAMAADAQEKWDAAGASISKAIELAGKTSGKSGQQITTDFDKANKSIESVGKSITKLDNSLVGLRQGVVNATKQIEEAGNRAGKSFQQTGTVIETVTKKATVDFGKLNQASADLAKSEERRQQAMVEASKRREQEHTANMRKIYEQANREVEKQAGIINAANQQISDGLTKAGAGAVTFGRGLALVGLAGEKDMKKILDTLIKVQAVVDLAKGGIDVYRGIADAVKAYRAAVVAATAAETALATARARTAAAGGARGVAGAAGGLLPGLAGGAGGTAVAGVSAGAAATTAVVGGLAIVGAAGLRGNVGGSNDALINRGWYDPGTFLGGLGRYKESGIEALFGNTSRVKDESSVEFAQKQARDSTKKVSALERQREINQQNMARDMQQSEQRFAIEQQLRNARSVQTQQLAISQGRERGLSGLDLERFITQQMQQSNRGQLGLDRANLGRARDANQGSVMQRQAVQQASGNYNQSLQEAIELTKRRLEIEKAIADQQKQATAAQLAGIQDAIALEQQKLDQAQGAIASGESRLGRASQEDRRKYVRASQKQQQGGRLSDDELALLERFGGEEQRAQVEEEYRKRGRKALQQGGGYNAEQQAAERAKQGIKQQQGFADEVAAQQAEEEAAAKRNIGGQERALDKLNQEAAKAEVQTVIDRTVEIKLQDNGIVERALAQVMDLLDKRDAMLAKQLEEAMNVRNAQRDADARAANAGFN